MIEITTKLIPHKFRNRYLVHTGKSNANISSIAPSGSGGGLTIEELMENFLPAKKDEKGNYTVPVSGAVTFSGDVIAQKEVSAYGKGTSGDTSGGTVNVYDGLDSTDPKKALSAKQGKILNDKLTEISGNTSGMTAEMLLNYYNKKEVEERLKTKAPLKHEHPISGVTGLSEKIKTYDEKVKSYDEKIKTYDTHVNDKVIHITADERTNWNDAYNKRHEHKNKAVLDQITQSNYDNWNSVYNDWTKAFYFDVDGNIRAKLNLIGDKEVSAYGKGEESGGGGGVVTIVNNLTSTLTNAALSANMGRELKDMIDSKVIEVDLSNYYDKNTIDTKLAGKSSTGHTHSQYLTSANLSGYATQDWVTGTCWTTTDFAASDIANWKTAYSNSHTHSNKSTLDGITSTKVSHWDTAWNNEHTHSNKSTLDGITSTKVSHWDTAWNNEHTHSNKSTLDGITSTKVSNWNTAYNNSHTHSNKSTLDGISSSDVTNWNGKVSRSGDTMTGDLTVNANVKTSGDLIFTNTSSIKVNSTEHMMFSSNDVTIYSTLDGDGYWNISDVGDAYFNGNVLSDSEITAYSDRRLKDNIKPLKNRGFIQPVTYTKNGKPSIGFIAQDVQAKYPELVLEDKSENHYLSVNYQQYTAVLQSQIIEQQQLIDKLTKEINNIKKYINYDTK